MLDLIKKVRNEFLADSTITDLVGERIHMPFSPADNNRMSYPYIVIDVDDGATDSITNDYRPDLRIHIWSQGDERVTVANRVAKQVLLNIDRERFLDSDPIIYQIWKDNAIQIFEDDTQLYHKTIMFSVVMEGYGGFNHPCD